MYGFLPSSSLFNDAATDKDMLINFKFAGNDISNLSILNPLIKDIANEGNVYLTLSGPLTNPVLNSKEFSLLNAKMYFNTDVSPIVSPLVITKNEIVISNNMITISDCNILWQGTDTIKYQTKIQALNHFSASGNVQINNLTLIKPKLLDIVLDIAISDTNLSINFPKIYQGDISIENCTVTGSYYIPLSRTESNRLKDNIATNKELGPLISTSLTLANGQIIMPTIEKKVPKPSFLLDIKCNIENSVAIGGGLFSGTAMSIFNSVALDLEATEKPLLISNSLNAPKIENSIVFYDGSINFLNRDFQLLNQDQQEIFYKENRLNVRSNSLSFDLEKIADSEKLRIVPILDIKALNIIEPLSVSPTASAELNNDIYKYVLININGPVYDLDSVVFEEYHGYSLDPNTNASYYNSYRLAASDSNANLTSTDTSRDLNAIMQLLMPDLVQDPHAEQASSSQQSTGKVVSGLSKNTINTIFRQTLRPLERRVAKGLGLYDLKIDYNLGQDLLSRASSLPGLESLNPGQGQSNLGIQFIKSLSEKLFLRLKTDLDISAKRKNDLSSVFSEIELSYYIYRNLSYNMAYIHDEDKYKARHAIKWSILF
jgi:hypothetical protein